MKKHLFLITSVFAGLTAMAQTSAFYVSPDTNVKVQGEALLYVEGSAKIARYSASDKKVSNEGKVKVTGAFTTSNPETVTTFGTYSGKAFVNEYPATGKYGQLIVSQGATTSGYISSVLKFGKGYVFYPLGIPYSNVTAGQIVSQITGEDASSHFITLQKGRNPKFSNFDPERYKNPLFFWNNDKKGFEHLAATTQLVTNASEAARYYALSTYAGSWKEAYRSEKKTLSGKPVNGSFTVGLTPYTISNNFWENDWGEVAGSYISDFTMVAPEGWANYGVGATATSAGGFGSNIFYLGNPYTSNIDLKKLIDQSNAASHITAIVQYDNISSSSYDVGVTKGTASNAWGSTMSGATGQGGGDQSMLLARPFHAFGIKTDGTQVNLNFNDAIKTFDLPYAGKNNLFNKTTGQDFSLAQVGITLNTKEGKATGHETYVAASDIYAKRNEEVTELHNIYLKDENIGIYTEQDEQELAARGGGKLYVNGINADTYVGRPVKLVMQNAQGTYLFKAKLNDVAKESANKFYFEDKKTGKVIKIGEDFAYGFTSNGTEKDRFAIYWAVAPKTNNIAESVKEVADATTIYKAGNDFKVRFDKGVKKADVYVYSISGQLVSSAKGVNASTDYVVPIHGNATVYIVKVIGDNGSVVTKKIIK